MSVGDSATPLGQARGLGSARDGGGHWLSERMSSVALLLLGSWLLASLLILPDLGRDTVAEWLRQPSAAVPMALFVITGFQHAAEGMKVVVDDYVHEEGNRFALNTLILFAAVTGVAISLFALGKIAFGAAA